jgi:RNA polymerase sigma factor (sigma-70 family)
MLSLTVHAGARKMAPWPARRGVPMNPSDEPSRLSAIKTVWVNLFQGGKADDKPEGPSRDLVLRYYSAVYRYLLGIVHDEEVATDLTQEFASRFLRGDFRKATPQRGRFRDFLKVALRNLAMDHFRKQMAARQRGMQPLPSGGLEPAEDQQEHERDDVFVSSFRAEVLNRTWEALADLERAAGKPYHTVLRLKIEHPDLSGAAMAERLSVALGRAVGDAAARQTLHRARAQFADLLLDEVSRTLGSPTNEELGQELSELGLLDYCKSALERRKRSKQ